MRCRAILAWCMARSFGNPNVRHAAAEVSIGQAADETGQPRELGVGARTGGFARWHTTLRRNGHRVRGTGNERGSAVAARIREDPPCQAVPEDGQPA